MENTILVKDLQQGYGKTIVLKDISLALKQGEILALIGPSGSGKSTLIKSVMGMKLPQKGTVKVLGTTMPNRKILSKIGFMAQNDALYGQLTGKENLEFFAELQGVPKKEMAKSITYSANVVNLLPHLNKYVKDYSGGMKRRLSLAIALVTNPTLLILDEPTVGIDPELRQQIWKELNKLSKAGVTILLTTHVMEDAEQADQLMMIRKGESIAQGSPKQLLKQFDVANIEDVFIKAGRVQDARLDNN
ncbi:ABC transporter ATP-binding protein [Fructilactobacillus sp. Tb1]|uniref:ABC transporter ATP-binding protein n=1 Tax=Fructilactobacillus sp. Tb1 TaxID=3422304 RepID=UPI003D26E5ED